MQVWDLPPSECAPGSSVPFDLGSQRELEGRGEVRSHQRRRWGLLAWLAVACQYKLPWFPTGFYFPGRVIRAQ